MEFAEFCNARCVILSLIHPHVVAMWNKVRCRIWIWCDAKCDFVQCQTRCGTWRIWWHGVLMQDVKRGCLIPSDVMWNGFECQMVFDVE